MNLLSNFGAIVFMELKMPTIWYMSWKRLNSLPGSAKMENSSNYFCRNWRQQMFANHFKPSLGPCLTSMVEFFIKIVNGFKPLPIFAKTAVWLGCNYTYEKAISRSHLYISRGKKCYFFGKFYKRTKWMISYDENKVKFTNNRVRIFYAVIDW